jgi:hypothetical protein
VLHQLTCLEISNQARQLLELNDWIGEGAVMEYYLMQEDAERDAFEGEDPEDMSEDDLSEEPRTLGGEPATGTSASGQRKDRPQRKKFATLGDLTAGEAAGDASDSDDPPQDFFAGGEKSGLAVQNPDDLKRKILEKAKRCVFALWPRFKWINTDIGSEESRVAQKSHSLAPDLISGVLHELSVVTTRRAELLMTPAPVDQLPPNAYPVFCISGMMGFQLTTVTSIAPTIR